MSSSLRRPGSRAWWATVIGGGGFTLALLIGPGRSIIWESPMALFVIVTIAASLCVVGAAVLLWICHRRNLAEAGLLTGGLMVVSILPLVHGLTAPGVLYGDNSAVTTSVYVALPLALLVMAPLVLRTSQVTRILGRHWRVWVWLTVGSAFVLAGVLLRWPNAITVPAPGHPITVVVTAVGLGGALWVSRVQLRLHWIGERRSTLVASLSLVLLGLTSLVWVGGPAFGVGWWAVHVLDIVGVLAGIVGVAWSHRLGVRVVEVLAPITELDPLRTLELGLAPVVHDFVAALEVKDPITRDHVVRTAELSIRVGEALGLPPRELRHVGIGALLHDIGKLRVSDEVLNKPGKLTDEEIVEMRHHAIDGWNLMQATSPLAGAAPIVRSHHERIDGRGYPDGLAGDAIPFGARIVAACDGYDAMAHTRQYRQGMGHDRAKAVLLEHAGSQWDAGVVEKVIEVAGSLVDTTPMLEGVGRGARDCGCADALPDEVRKVLSLQD